MDNDFPLAASYDSTYLRSFECSCQLYKSRLRRRNHLISHPYSFTLSNMIKTIMHFSLGSVLSLCN